MDKFPRRKSVRLKEYDYSQRGYYFVTICTYNRFELFGTMESGEMALNQFGDIAQKVWQDLPNHHEVELDEFIIMPNHVHGIIINNNPVGNRPACSANIPACSVNKNNNLSVVVGSYKSSVTKQINKINNDGFRWQKSFYDHIIRTTDSLKNIREYIVNNPEMWENDENNLKNIK